MHRVPALPESCDEEALQEVGRRGWDALPDQPHVIEQLTTVRCRRRQAPFADVAGKDCARVPLPAAAPIRICAAAQARLEELRTPQRHRVSVAQLVATLRHPGDGVVDAVGYAAALPAEQLAGLVGHGIAPIIPPGRDGPSATCRVRRWPVGMPRPARVR